MPRLREPRRKPDLDTNTAPDLINDDRRRDMPRTRPDTLDERARRDEGTPEDRERDAAA